MFENVYYTICKEEYLNSNEYEDIQPIEEVISSTAYAKNKIIDEDYSYLTVKQLNLISLLTSTKELHKSYWHPRIQLHFPL